MVLGSRQSHRAVELGAIHVAALYFRTHGSEVRLTPSPHATTRGKILLAVLLAESFPIAAEKDGYSLKVKYCGGERGIEAGRQAAFYNESIKSLRMTSYEQQQYNRAENYYSLIICTSIDDQLLATAGRRLSVCRRDSQPAVKCFPRRL